MNTDPAPKPDLETVWRPHRDAPSLIDDMPDGRSTFPNSSLLGARIAPGAYTLPKAKR